MGYSPYLLIFSILIISSFPHETLATCSDPCKPSPSTGPTLPLPPVPIVGPVVGPVVGGLPLPPVPVVGPVVGGGLPLPPVVPVVGPVIGGGGVPVVGPVIGGGLPVPPVVPVVGPVIGGGVPLPPIVGKPPVTTPPVIGKPPSTKPCPTPSTPSPHHRRGGKCPIDTVKLGACLNVLGVVGAHVGKGVECCPLIGGLAAADAALCLCTAIKVKALGIGVYLPIALELLVTCGKKVPHGYHCP